MHGNGERERVVFADDYGKLDFPSKFITQFKFYAYMRGICVLIISNSIPISSKWKWKIQNFMSLLQGMIKI